MVKPAWVLRQAADGAAHLLRCTGTAVLSLAVIAGCQGAEHPSPTPPTIRLAWPLGGVFARDWVVNNYVDLQPGPGTRDYQGGARTYDRHQGTDIDVPNFRWMDRGFPVLAAAGGVVTATHDGEFDRNTGCGFLDVLSRPNLVEVTHQDGSRTRYLHLRRGSVKRVVGERVSAGDEIGTVGSSGCSTAPHLHFEVRGPAGQIVDPFHASLWTNSPPYRVPLTLMDYVVKDGRVAGESELKDPAANASKVSRDRPLGIGLFLAGGAPRDVVEVRLEGAALPSLLAVLRDGPAHRYWFWNVPAAEHRGIRGIAIHANGSLLARHPLHADRTPEP